MGTWIEQTLGSLIKEEAKSPLQVQHASNFGDFPFFTSGDIVMLHVNYLIDGEILFLATGGKANVKYYNGRSAYSTDTYAISSDKICPRFLYYLLLNKIGYIDSNFFTGSGLKHLQKADLRKWKLLVPEDRSEQTRIAEILSKADEAIAQTEALIAKYQRIKTGLMQDLLTKGIDEHGNIRSKATHRFVVKKGIEVPEEWEVEELGNYILKIDSGWSPVCEGKPASFGEWGSLKTTAVTWKGYDPNENKRLPDELTPRKSIEVKEDDILITRVGPRERVGVVVHVNDSRPRLMLSDNMLRLRIKDNSRFYLPYLPFALGSDFVQKEWKSKIAGLAEAQVVINQQVIKYTRVPIPSRDEQIRVFDYLIAYKKAEELEAKKLQKLLSLKLGLMQDLLSGKVSVKMNN